MKMLTLYIRYTLLLSNVKMLPKGITYKSATRKHTYQAVDHLIGDCSQTPPVHCPVIGFFTKNFWCQVLQTVMMEKV